MTTHAVAPELLDALACGDGDPGGMLRAGVRSKRLLLLHELMATARRLVPHLVAEGQLDTAYATLVDAHRRARHIVDAVLLQPHVGAWAARCLRQLLATGDVAPDDLGHLGAVAAASALRAGRGVDVRAHLRGDRSLMLPSYGLAHLGEGGGWCRIRACSGSGGIEILARPRPDVPGGGRGGLRAEVGLRPPPTSVHGPVTWLPLRRLRSVAAGLVVEMDLDDLDPFRQYAQQPCLGRLGDELVEDWQAKLDRAWSSLVEHHRSQAEAIANTVQACVPLQTTDAGRDLSATSHDALGAVGMSPPRSSLAVAVALVHEHRHDLLFRLTDLVPLGLRTSGEQLYSPWRADPRPMWGLYHGAYAFLGLAEFWEVRSHRHDVPRSNGLKASFELALARNQVARALRELRAPRSLPPLGVRFVEGMHRRLRALRQRTVPGPVQELADMACQDHATSWRLRNVQPDPGQVSAWAEAWSSGRRCPWLGAPRGTVVDGGGPMPSSARLQLLRDHLVAPGRQPVGLAGTTRADILLVEGDLAGAADAYEAQIGRGLGDLAAWAGLALAGRHRPSRATWALATVPEIVQAVHRAVAVPGAKEAGPGELASWLGDGLQGAGDR